jgi:hypothetical protein
MLSSGRALAVQFSLGSGLGEPQVTSFDAAFDVFPRCVAVALLICVLPNPTRAQPVDKTLEERIAKEKDDRRDCKIKIFDATLNQRAEGEDIAASTGQTFRDLRSLKVQSGLPRLWTTTQDC